MKKLFYLMFVFLVPFLSSCHTANYISPEKNINTQIFTREISKSFDDTWRDLINYSASTFFNIDNYEKASGLLTLSFSADKPSEYVTGGRWDSNGLNTFHGDYADYLKRFYAGKLFGKINIIVARINDNLTRVTIKVRYIYETPATPASDSYLETWIFDSGNCATINVSGAATGTPGERTMCPTNKLENGILDAIEKKDIVNN